MNRVIERYAHRVKACDFDDRRAGRVRALAARRRVHRERERRNVRAMFLSLSPLRSIPLRARRQRSSLRTISHGLVLGGYRSAVRIRAAAPLLLALARFVEEERLGARILVTFPGIGSIAPPSSRDRSAVNVKAENETRRSAARRKRYAHHGAVIGGRTIVLDVERTRPTTVLGCVRVAPVE